MVVNEKTSLSRPQLEICHTDIINLKILIIASHQGFGGVHVDKLFPSLVKMGCDITFVGWDRKNALQKRFERNGVSYHMIFKGWGYANKLLMIALPLWILRVASYLPGKGRKYDLVIAIDFDAGLPVALTQFITGVPFIYNIRDNFAMRTTLPKLLRPIVAMIDRWIIKCATRIIVPDESRITATDESTMDKFAVIYNCAPDIKPAINKPETHPFTVYAMGYLLKTRGIHLLLEAAARLPDIRVLLAGTVHEADIERQILSTPNVDFRGKLPQKDALRLCHESDVIFTFYDPVSEINRKAASNKWSDAMMSGKPLIVNSEVLKSAWIRQQDIGYLCPYGDVDQLVRIIQHIRQHQEEAQRKGSNGRRLYDVGYNWPVMEQRLKKVLNEVNPNMSFKGKH